jgi:hypothetical protein
MAREYDPPRHNYHVRGIRVGGDLEFHIYDRTTGGRAPGTPAYDTRKAADRAVAALARRT